MIKKILINTALVSVSLAVGLVCIEAILFFTPYRAQILPLLEPYNYITFNEERGHDIAPSYATSTFRFADGKFDVSSNSVGCFDAPFLGEEPYVYLAGDSFTWGFAPLEDKWGKIIERELGVRALTCGVNGYGTLQQLLKSEEILEQLLNPRLIIVGYLPGNDIEDDLNFPNYIAAPGGYRVSNPISCVKDGELSPEPCRASPIGFSPLQKIKKFLGTQSVVYVLLRDRAYLPLSQLGEQKYPEQGVPSLAGSLPSVHRNAILAFKELANEKNTKLLFVIIPSKKEIESGKSLGQFVRPTLEELDIPYFDLFPEFQKQGAGLLYWKNDGHWNIAGNRLAGELVAQYILENNLLEKDE